MDDPLADPGPVETVHRYYRALDAHEYAVLEGLLHPEFRQRRPDRVLEGRDRFVAFMRDERPRTDTTHDLLRTLAPATSSTVERSSGHGDVTREESTAVLAVVGRLVGAEGDAILEFVDVHELDASARSGPRLRRLDTYTR